MFALVPLLLKASRTAATVFRASFYKCIAEIIFILGGFFKLLHPANVCMLVEIKP